MSVSAGRSKNAGRGLILGRGKRLQKLSLYFLFLISFVPAVCQQPDMEHATFQVGEINYYGYAGIDLDPIRAQLPLHTGDKLTFATFSRDAIEVAITRLAGHRPTDIAIVCCDQAKHLFVYIGLGGASSRPMPVGALPSGHEHLDPTAARLYDQGMAALLSAVSGGNAGEDDSKGYMLSNDPALRQIDLSILAYAAPREAELVRVLRNASDSHQRQIAAAFLGYVPRSSIQVEALTAAVNDPDDEVRNNAVRALSVLSAARNSAPLLIDPHPCVALLFSGKWTDRNKGSMLLLRLTENRDSTLLASLRHQAIEPLIEGASWHGDSGHSTPFLVVLSRCLSIPEDALKQLIDTHNTVAIIAAANKE